MPKKQVLQGGGIILHGPHVILRRTKAGKWIFPKGHVEPGETTAQTALRESEEETGLQVELIEPVGSAQYKDGDERVTVEYFLLRAVAAGPHWDRHHNVDAFPTPLEQVAAHLSFGYLRRLWATIHPRVTTLTSSPTTPTP
jgi:diadenosine hexaphosphate hydrolase (ATP-forming)